MQVNYALSSPVIPVSSSSTVDLLISFTSEAAGATPSRRPLNLSLVIDRSGSMAGAPLQYAIEAAQRLVEQLTPEDYLSVVIYDDHAETILPHGLVQDKPYIQVITAHHPSRRLYQPQRWLADGLRPCPVPVQWQ